MSTHELDSYQSTEHQTDFTQLGSVFARDLGFDLTVGFDQDLKQTPFSLVAQIQMQTHLNSTTEMRMRPCNRTASAVQKMIASVDAKTDKGKYSDYWCFSESARLELLGNREFGQFRVFQLALQVDE